MDTIKLNIAIRFEDQLLDQMGELLTGLDERYEVKYIADNKNSIPHITLYQNIFPAKKLKEIEQLLSDIAGNTSEFTLRFNRLIHNRSTIWAGFERTPELISLHQRITEEVQPLRDGLVEEQFKEDHPVFLALPEQKKEMLAKWGHPYVMDAFDPHISLLKLVDRELVYVVLRRINWNLMKIPVAKIAIYKGGEEGICKELLSEFDLQN